jgi:amidase
MKWHEYRDMDASQLAEQIRTRELSASEVLDAAAERAQEVNVHTGAIVYQVFDRVNAKDGRPADGAFGGVPFFVKDLNIDVAGWPLSNGSRFFREHVCDSDSELVRRYRSAGLMIVGRSASSEFGLSADSSTTLYGPTRNPWDVTCSAGGSSGGAAVLVATGVVPVAQGGDGGGSIRIPAARCGVVGLKPSKGRVPCGPRYGEGWFGLSATHVLSRTVRDSAAFLDITAGPELGAPYQAPEAGPFALAVNEDPGPLRIGLQTRAFGGELVDEECRRAAEKAASACAAFGHSVEPVDFVVDAEDVARISFVIQGTSVMMALKEGAKEQGRRWKTGDLEPLTEEMVRQAESLTAEDLGEALANVHRLRYSFARFLGCYDVILTPTTATHREHAEELALYGSDLDQYRDRSRRATAFTKLYNIAGAPAISLPCSWQDEMPVGIQLGSSYGREDVLLKLAAQLERAAPWRTHYQRCLPAEAILRRARPDR